MEGTRRAAPLPGSVDRNDYYPDRESGETMEPLPSRGAWIEMYGVQRSIANLQDAAPLPGSVDRNPLTAMATLAPAWPLPSRGAWIEIGR